MAETISGDEVTFDAKRKPDPCCGEKEERSNKLQKFEVVEGDYCNDVKNGENGDHKQSDEQIDDSSLVAEVKDGGVLGADVDSVEVDDEGDEEGDYEGEEEDDSEDSENSSGKAAEDRKGKGIMKDVKGKGKLIEVDDDDEDSSDDGSELGSDESDFSDDPLAEVDLDNILPSRTRRRAAHPGVHFATDLGNKDDDSSDSDA